MLAKQMLAAQHKKKKNRTAAVFHHYLHGTDHHAGCAPTLLYFFLIFPGAKFSRLNKSRRASRSIIEFTARRFRTLESVLGVQKRRFALNPATSFNCQKDVPAPASP